MKRATMTTVFLTFSHKFINLLPAFTHFLRWFYIYSKTKYYNYDMYEGGDYNMLIGKEIIREVTIPMTELISEYIEQRNVIQAEVTHNFQIVNGSPVEKTKKEATIESPAGEL